MSVVDTEFEAAIQRIEATTKQFEQCWNNLVAAANQAIPQLPGYLQPVAKGSFNKLSAKKDNALEKLVKIYTERGSASAVRQVASDWNTEVGEKMSALANSVTVSQLPSFNRWEGPAYIAYKETVAFQCTKLTEVKTMTDGVSTTLNEIADAMKAFWNGMATAYVSYVVSMQGCAVGLMTVVGTIPSIIAAIGLSIKWFDDLGKLATDFANVLDSKQAALERQQTLNGTEGRWPPINTEALADASVLDDDRTSDWTPRP
jgi:uncharacterized protein YukE